MPNPAKRTASPKKGAKGAKGNKKVTRVTRRHTKIGGKGGKGEEWNAGQYYNPFADSQALKEKKRANAATYVHGHPLRVAEQHKQMLALTSSKNQQQALRAKRHAAADKVDRKAQSQTGSVSSVSDTSGISGTSGIPRKSVWSSHASRDYYNPPMSSRRQVMTGQVMPGQAMPGRVQKSPHPRWLPPMPSHSPNAA